MQFMKKPKTNNEQGIVSIMVTIILMLVISLIVISFARTSRREQRDSFDRQLSTNAFYAAESGINTAQKAIIAGIKTNPNYLDKSYMSNCTGPGSFAEKISVTLPSSDIGSTGSNAKYTCLFVDPTVSSIEHSLTSDSYVFPIKKSGPGSPGMGEVDFFWDAGKGSDANYTDCPDKGENPQTWPQATCSSGVLRLELTDASDLSKNQVYFIYPSKGAAEVVNYGSDPTGSTLQANCSLSNKPYQCSFKVTSLNNTVYARVSGLYMDYELSVGHSGGSTLKFADAQVIIDATGRAADVQRRIQVRFNLNNFGGPISALQGGAATCKKFTIDGTTATDAGGCWGSIPTRTGNQRLP